MKPLRLERLNTRLPAVGAQQADILKRRQIQDLVADSDADPGSGIGVGGKDAEGQVLDWEMAVGFDIDKRLQPGSLGCMTDVPSSAPFRIEVFPEPLPAAEIFVLKLRRFNREAVGRITARVSNMKAIVSVI